MSKEFTAQLYQLANRIEQTKEHIKTEEATKMAFIVPFFQALGYDVYNPTEFIPEFIADVGNKKGEKVDYAIMRDGIPVILIEAKGWSDTLTNHDDQLYRYFTSTKAKFAILTNGIVYKFFTDLESPNIMDGKPFLDINLLDLKDNQIFELKKFVKENFDLDAVFSSASELKYSNNIKLFLAEQMTSPTEEFVKFILGNIYDGIKTQSVIDKFTPVVKKSLNQFINEILNERLSSVINPDGQTQPVISEPSIELTEEEANSNESKIVTTEEEIQAFYIIKSIFAETVALDKIVAKDTETYFGVLYENNTRKWICRLKISPKRKLLILPAEDNREAKYPLDTLTDLYKYRTELLESVNRFI
ncbi:type I restriction endonuclease [Anaerotignum propionicum]|uniref:type I restriction endonuclease n=1 Tax=Anaerotignum propionicum TaxID=28446 RepID=UPI00289B05FC|nr:type I restriction endonuclease [Anaerotignum propionicum]